MEDARLQDMLHQTVANRQSKGYHYLMTELFAVESRPVADFTYDIDMHKVFIQVIGTVKTWKLNEHLYVRVGSWSTTTGKAGL